MCYTWVDFEVVFDNEYISYTMREMKVNNFTIFNKGDMMVLEYEKK